MNVELIEFNNKRGDTLRGILSIPNKEKIEKVVVFVHGFERISTGEKKFKKISDALFSYDVASFRFDFTGQGISDGEFKYTTVKNMVSDLENAINIVKEITQTSNISLVGHSLGACVIASYTRLDKIKEILLIAPALNQKDLLRYWFVKSLNKDVEITWENFKEYLDEEKFREYTEIEERETKTDIILKDYFIENRDKDYSQLLERHKDKILHIHGNNDDKVPLESLNIEFPNRIIVDRGDHDLEKPSMRNQWIMQATAFISSNTKL